MQGRRGAIGHIPSYLAHRFSPALVRFDVDMGEPVRKQVDSAFGAERTRPGEALGKVVDDPANVGSRV